MLYLIKSSSTNRFIEPFICNDTTTVINLDILHTVILNTTLKITKYFLTRCQFIFNSNVIPDYKDYLFNFQLLEIKQLENTNVYISVSFRSEDKPLFKILLNRTDMIFKNVFLTRLFGINRFEWGNSRLYMTIEIYNPNESKIIIVITPILYCKDKSFYKSLFLCDVRYNERRICIENRFKCDGWNNCPSDNEDESPILCKSQFVNHVLIPSVILSCTIFILGWILLKITPCILEQRRLFILRRNRFFFGSNHRTGSLASIGANTGYIPELGIAPHSSDLNITPDNIPQSPPKYQNIYNPQNNEHQLPPSYSDDMEIGVVPGFFKRFFGKHRNTTNVISSNTNIEINNGVEQQKNKFKTIKTNLQYRGIESFSGAGFPLQNNELENIVFDSKSESLTTVTSTDEIWNGQNANYLSNFNESIDEDNNENNNS